MDRPLLYIVVFKDGSYVGEKCARDAHYTAQIHADEYLCTIDVQAATETMLKNNTPEAAAKDGGG